MRFALEALQADHGDALLLHWGTAADPHLLVIDGGPSGIYRNVLRPRLVALAAERTDAQLDVDALMVSHIDDDHINGVEALLKDLANNRLPAVQVQRLWFNSLERLAQGDPNDGFVALGATRPAALRRVAAKLGAAAGFVIASVGQGNRVSELAAQLGIAGNRPFGGLIVRKQTPRSRAFEGLTLTVLGPSQARIDQLRSMWQQAAAARPDPAALAFVDDSVPNLSSIVMLIEASRKRMVLTGDARGDDVLEGLRSAGLLTRSTYHVQVLKMPHHGSDRNVDTDFFRTVTADNYVISGNGKYSNPELATLAMLTEARRGDDFTIYLTNREPRVVQWFDRNRVRADRYDVQYRRSNQSSITVELAGN